MKESDYKRAFEKLFIEFCDDSFYVNYAKKGGTNKKPIFDLLLFTTILTNVKKVFTQKVNYISSKVDEEVTLFINWENFSKLPMQEQKERIYSEILHITCCHHARAKKVPNFEMFGIAADLSISNYTPSIADLPRIENFNGEDLPENCTSITAFKHEKVQKERLQHNEITEYYYDYLQRYQEEHPEMCSMSGGEGKEEGEEGESPEEDGQGGKGSKKSPQLTMKTGNGNVKSDPDHEKWKEGTGNEDLSKEIVKDFMRKAIAMSGVNPGDLSGDLKLIIDGLFNNQVDWKKEIRKFVARKWRGNVTKTRKKPNRRTGILNPGKKKGKELHICAIIDTSGSMSDDQLKQIKTELVAMNKEGAKITIINADTVVTDIFEFDPKKEFKISGRGGTAYGPALAAAEELKVDGILYLGDMDCADVPEEPKTPVMWVATNRNKKPPVEWGHRTYMDC